MLGCTSKVATLDRPIFGGLKDPVSILITLRLKATT